MGIELKVWRLFFACFGGTVLAAFASARPEPNAFLNTLAPNLTALIKQVRSDPEVYTRYARHFGMTKIELVTYFAGLKLAKIERSGPYVVYSAREDGIIRSRIFNLKAGSLVYVDTFGTPVLKKICGNPMVQGPNHLNVVNLVHEAPLAPANEVKVIPEEGPQPETPTEMMVAEELAQPPFTPENPLPPVTLPVETPPTLTPPDVTPPIETVVKGSFEGIGFLAPLLSGAFIQGHGSSGGHGAVPEPATIGMVVSLVGLYGFCRVRCRAR